MMHTVLAVIILVVICFGHTSFCLSLRPVAIVTGGTRGLGSGIASTLADAGYDLVLTYNTNTVAAQEFSSTLPTECHCECVSGDISLTKTRDKIFACCDDQFPDQPLQVMVHNAGQYVGITSDNAEGLTGDKPLSFGNGSLLNQKGATDLETMNYYQQLYGEAWVDLCERSLVRMTGPGSLIGISSPSVCAALYGPDPSYSMPGSGKCLMEYSMRVYALQAAVRNINVNIVIPGVVRTEAWKKLAQKRGLSDETQMMEEIVQRIVPMKISLSPRQVGNALAFLCSDAGKFITGTVLPVDGGVHLKQ